jgi:hypothetical protein
VWCVMVTELQQVLVPLCGGVRVMLYTSVGLSQAARPAEAKAQSNLREHVSCHCRDH